MDRENRLLDWFTIKSVLCIRLDSMGDVLMTSPAIRAIKESHPDCKVSLLTSPSGASAAKLLPEIDEIIQYEAPWMKATQSRQKSAYDREMIDTLAHRKFDVAVIFTVYTQSPYPAIQMAYLSDIPNRIAYSRENPYQLLNVWVPEIEPSGNIRHEVRRQLDLVSSINCYTSNEKIQVHVEEKDLDMVRQEILALGLSLDVPFIVIHPGATAESRRYSPEGFAQVAHLLASDLNMSAIFMGSNKETGLIEGLRQLCPEKTYSLAGRLNLAQYAALLRQATLLISNNTGPVHLASGVGTPVVDLYALTNPQHTPWGIPSRVLFHDVPCKFCYKSICPQGHHNCLKLVTPEQIVAAVKDLLSEVSTSNNLQMQPGISN